MLSHRLHAPTLRAIPILSDAHLELLVAEPLAAEQVLPRLRYSSGTSFPQANGLMITKLSSMKLFPSSPRALRARTREQANIRIVVSVVAFFLLGAAVGAFWGWRAPRPAQVMTNSPVVADSSDGLSPVTKGLLASLKSPVEIRYYCVLDPANTSEAMRAFAGRVDQLLLLYQKEAMGKISVARSNSLAYATADSAVADGIKPFDEERGEPSFLGIAVSTRGQKASLSQLAPEWESALEADITRTIRTTLNAAPSSHAPGLVASKDNTPILDDLRRSIPNLDSISLAEATRMVREASLKDFASAASQSQIQLKEAQQRLKDAQTGGSENEQQAAIRDLQQVQADQTEQLKRIAARTQAQIEALKRLKADVP